MLSKEETSAITKLVQDSKILTQEGKDLYLFFLENPEEQSDEFYEAIQSLIESESAYLDEQLKTLPEKISFLKKQKEQEQKLLQEKSNEVSEKLPILMKEEVEKTNEKINSAEKRFDQEVEKIIHEEGEQSQIDAIREGLLKSKSDS